MPEGPEIRKAADTLRRALAPLPVDKVFFAFDHLKAFEGRLRRQHIQAIEARGKALLIHFENRLCIYSHNQLYGRWMVRRKGRHPDTRRQLRLAIHNQVSSALLYSASEIQVLSPEQIGTHPYLSGLGPDVLSADEGEIRRQLDAERFRRRRLWSLLLDQRCLAGVGNYLRSEILFVARLHPGRRPADCDDEELRGLAAAARAVSMQSYRHNGVTNDLKIARALRVEGQSRGRYRHWVFGRGGRPCRICGTPVIEALAASRRIYHCPVCQPE